MTTRASRDEGGAVSGLSEGEREALVDALAEAIHRDKHARNDTEWIHPDTTECVGYRTARKDAEAAARIVDERTRDARERLARVEAVLAGSNQGAVWAVGAHSRSHTAALAYRAIRTALGGGHEAAEGAQAGAGDALAGSEGGGKVTTPETGVEAVSDDYTRGWQDALAELRKRMEDA